MRRTLVLLLVAGVVLATASLPGCDLIRSILGIQQPDGGGDDTDEDADGGTDDDAGDEAPQPVVVPRDGLVAEWLFSGGAADTSPSAIAATVSGATLTDDPSGTASAAYAFDGASYIRFASPLGAGTTAFSVSLWVKTQVLDAERLALHLSPATGEVAVGLHHEHTGRLAFSVALPGYGWYSLMTSTDLATGRWYHAVGVFENRSAASLWVDGAIVTSADVPPSDFAPNSIYAGWPSCIGSYSSAYATRFWVGSIDNVRLYNRALTAEDVATLYAEHAGAPEDGDDDGGTTPPAGAALAVTSPNGGEHWETSTSQSIRWTTTLSSPTVQINLTKSGTYYRRIVDSTANSGSYTWSIPSDIEESTAYRVHIQATDNAGQDTSDGAFTITTKPYIRVTRPNGGETWGVGYSKDIEWSTANAGANVKIDLYYSGAFESTIVSSTANDGSYDWDVDCNHPVAANPDRLEAFYKVKVTSTSNTSLSDMSDAAFEIWD